MPKPNHSLPCRPFDEGQAEDARTKKAQFDPHRERSDPGRKEWGAQPLFTVLRCEEAYPGQKTKALSPCWAGSTRKPVKWRLVAKKEAAELVGKLEDYERQTRKQGHQDGAIGRNGLAIFRAFVFTFLNWESGRLDPGYKSIALAANISVRSVARGLVKLKAAGVLDWVRRCTAKMKAGRVELEQETNAYGIVPASCWFGYKPTAKHQASPPPHPDTYGATPPLPSAIEAAQIEQRQGGSMRAVLRQLESDTGDALAAVLARLGRTMGLAETE